jgi:Flp pilus assembly protein TadD
MVLDTKTHILELIEQRRFDEADEQLRGLMVKSPKDGPLHSLRALCLLELEGWQDAIDVARRAAAIAPEAAYCQWALAIVRLHCHEFRKARVSAAKAVQLDPASPEGLFVLARAEAGQEHWDEALAALDSALALDPDHEACRMLRGLILDLRGSAAPASSEFLAALKQNPEHAIARAARVALDDEPKRGVLARFANALRRRPTSGSARAGLLPALGA